MLTSLTGRLVLAITIGVAVVGIDNGVAALVMQQSVNLHEEAGVMAVQILLVSIPFLLLAFAGVVNRLPWFLGVALTAFFWGLLLSDAIKRQGDGSGANIGLSLLLLLSPLIISIVTLVAAKSQDRNAAN